MTTEVGIAPQPGLGQATVRLPDVIHFTFPAQHAVVILEALGNHGSFKVVQPVIQNFEQQLLSQRIRPEHTPTSRAFRAAESEKLPDLADGI